MRVTAEGQLFLTVETETGERFALNTPIGLELEDGVVRLTSDRAAPLLTARSAALEHGIWRALQCLLASSLSPRVSDPRSAPSGPGGQLDRPRTSPRASDRPHLPGDPLPNQHAAIG